MNQGDTVTDQYNQEHTIRSELGKGGQGIVYTTNDPEIAIKLVLTKDGEPYKDKEYITSYHQLLDNLLTLPLSQGLNLARPICKLKDHAGYVMQQLRDMKPVEDLLPIYPKNIEDIKYPQWLDGFIKGKRYKDAYTLVHYAQTGSTKRRFEILMQCAAQLAKLHGQGLVYGDISNENVFFSENKVFNHVWFIDADNLRFENKISKKAVFTPGYGAPELVLGQVGASTNTDAYSFSVLAFKLLSLLHPFDGEKLLNGDDDGDWANEEDDTASCLSIFEQAQAGLLPFIDDPDDDSNRNNSGLPRPLILTDTIINLFNNTFNKAQRNPWKRPLMFHWPKALAQAVDASIECTSCNMSYLEKYAQSENKCPYCSAKAPRYLSIQRFAINTLANPDTWRAVMSELDSEICLPKRLFTPFELDDFDDEFARIHKETDHWELSLSFSYSEKINVALNKPGENFSPLVSKLELTEDELKIGVLLQIAGDFPQQVTIMLKGAQ
mgnify:CR=1 FL=1